MNAEEKIIIAKEGKPKESKNNTERRVNIPSLKPKVDINEMRVDPEKIEKLRAQQMDLFRLFKSVFDNSKGKKLLDYLEEQAHKDFPNYGNVYATYSKIGEQTLVSYIKNMLNRAKELS